MAYRRGQGRNMGIWMQPAGLDAKTTNAAEKVLSAVLFVFLSDFESLGRWVASEITSGITST